MGVVIASSALATGVVETDADVPDSAVGGCSDGNAVFVVDGFFKIPKDSLRIQKVGFGLVAAWL